MTTVRATKVQLGQHAIYNNNLPAQGGGSKAMDNLAKANTYAKKHKLVTKGDAVVGALGLRNLVNKKTGGAYSVGVDFAKTKGYGKKKKTHRKKK